MLYMRSERRLIYASVLSKLVNHAYLILNEKLDTLDGSSCGFRDGSGDTTH